ncbi:BglG family transcription antiterminator LicT [Alloiococcus sp. CFN-8]|uniref:BglG family transcription antiterminator LicT n=1 Tax=Alloiococcus sp. CFN-8 TaxID=3416081 RepID=UPI003CF757CA
MKVLKVINNNIVKSLDSDNHEVIVVGKGLGFKKKPGDDIDRELIAKIYTSKDRKESNKLTELLEKMPLEHIQVSNEVISFAKVSLGRKLNDNIYLTLTDHISFALERYSQGITFKNALLWEIKRFYSHEFLIGKEALSIIHKRLGVSLPEDEAGFIALHLVNASMNSQTIGETKDMTRMIQDILNIVKYHFRMDLDEYTLHYERFITHLKFFAQRVFQGSEIKGEDKNFLFALKEQFKEEYTCALKVRDYVIKEYNRDLSEDEMIYLTVHIKRVTTE